MQIRYDKYFIQRYINGECSEEERRAFLQWLNHPHTRENDAWMQEVWEEGILQDKDFLGAENRILHKVLVKIKKSDAYLGQAVLPHAIHKITKIQWHRFSAIRYAAVILLLIVPLVLLQYYKSNNVQPLTTTPVYHKKFTEDAQRLTFRLEDGSQITLNANSSLEFPETFSDTLREVILYGEAFFEVARDVERPFTVMAGNVSTMALGTSFNIRNDTSEHKTTVSLASGKVRVQNRKPGEDQFNIYLSPGEELDYHTYSKTYTKNHFDYQEKIAWKDGILYFGEDNIDAIVSKLEHWYGVTIELKNRPAEEWYFDGAFKDQSLENVLAGMAYAKGFEFSIEGKKVVLTF